ncbi:unnamed protein product [Cunninghamella blakesleeana]
MVSTNTYKPQQQPLRQSSYDYNEQQHKKNNDKSINQSQQRRTQSLSIESSSSNNNNNNKNEQRRPTSPSAFNELPRLSIADRFMSSTNSNNNNNQYSPFTSSPLSYKSTVFSDKNNTNNNNSNINDNDDHLSPSMSTSKSMSKRPSTQLSLSSESMNQERPRLTIASSFMKSEFSNQDSNTQSSSNVHPLESASNNEENYNFDLSLDLDLPKPNSYQNNNNNLKRPFGSQDTLVGNELKSKTKLKNGLSEDEYYDVALNDYYSPKRTLENDLLEEDEHGIHDDNSDVSSTTRHGDEENDMDLQHSKEKPSNTNKYNHDDDDHTPKGFWIGCCFLTYGRKRPNDRTMMMLTKKKQHERNCGRRWRVFALFLSFIVIIIMTTILWPRTPLIRVEGASLLQPAKITETIQGTIGSNVQFESQWMVNFTIDNRQNWIVPTRLVQLHVLVKDSLTGNIIGKGFQNDHPEPITLAPQSISTLQLGVSLDYQARDMLDSTISSLKNACTVSSSNNNNDNNNNNNNNNNNTNNNNNNNNTNNNNNSNNNNTNNNNNNTNNNNNNNSHNDNNNSSNNNHNNINHPQRRHSLLIRGPGDSSDHNNNNSTNSNNNTTSNNMLSNNTLQNNHSFSNLTNIASPPEHQHEPLSLLFWMTLHIWGLDVFGYLPTIMVAPATGGFVCPLN